MQGLNGEMELEMQCSGSKVSGQLGGVVVTEWVRKSLTRRLCEEGRAK
jgi:hypothetical protein